MRYVAYEGASETNAVHRLPKGQHMTPVYKMPTRTGYTFKGWDTAHEIDNGDGTSTVYGLWDVDLTDFTNNVAVCRMAAETRGERPSPRLTSRRNSPHNGGEFWYTYRHGEY